MKDFFNSSQKIISVIGLLSVIVVISGFLILNIYLQTFGFWDYSIFQPRYIAVGLPFLLFFTIIGALHYAYSSLKIFLVLVIFSYLPFLLLYAFLIFPNMPYSLGGGKPIMVAMMFSEEDKNIIPYIKNETSYDFYIAFKLLYQTPNFVLLESNNGVFLINNDRIKSIFYDKNHIISEDSIGKQYIFINEATSSSHISL